MTLETENSDEFPAKFLAKPKTIAEIAAFKQWSYSKAYQKMAIYQACGLVRRLSGYRKSMFVVIK